MVRPFVALALILCLLLPPPAAAATGPDTRFGMVNILPDGYNLYRIPGHAWMTLAKDAGARSNRWEFRWDDMQNEPGPGSWATADWIVGENAKAGMSLTGVIIATPAWASTTGRPGRSVPINLDQPALLPDGSPNPANPWANFVYWTAKRYAGRVSAWQMWNEPNLGQFWLGTPQQYAQLLKAGYLAVKAADPKAQVVFGGISGSGPEFLKEVLAAIREDPQAMDYKGYFDVFAWHGYTRPATIFEYTHSYRALLGLYGLNKPIWLGETGVAAWDDPSVAEGAPRPFGEGATQTEQAYFVVQAIAYALAAGVERVQFYRGSDVGEGRSANGSAIPAWGMVRVNGTTRPAYTAYRAMATLLAGTTLLQVERSPQGYDRFSFQGAGKVIHIVFSLGTSGMRAPVPAFLGEKATVLDVVGNATPVGAANRQFAIDLRGASAGNGVDPLDIVVPGAPVIIVEGNQPGMPSQPGVVAFGPVR